ncbi:MAG: rod shape-determining protein MreC [Bacillota bacterium]
MARRVPLKRGLLIGLLIAVFLAAIGLTSASERARLTQVEIILRDMIAPLYSGVTQVSTTFLNIRNSITSYHELLEENRYLKEQVRLLSLQNSNMEEYRLENERLNRLLNFKVSQENEWDLMPAVVIGRNLGNWRDTVIINRGIKDGVHKDMPVINHQGLVGRVIAVTNNTAEVLLLIDRDSAVGALVQRSRTFGVVEAATADDIPLQMIHLAHDAPINEGDVIVTSGLGGIFPKGLKIGYVAEINMAPTGLVKQAKIIPYVDFGKLEELLIVKEAKEILKETEVEEGVNP